MAIYVNELAAAIVLGYFDATLREYIGNTLKFRGDNGRKYRKSLS